jgi:hypothetical protein
MTPDQLQMIGETLYGPHYKDSLKKGLGVSRRTIDRWLAETFPIPDSIFVELVAICLEKLDAIDDEAKKRRDTLRELLWNLS